MKNWNLFILLLSLLIGSSISYAANNCNIRAKYAVFYSSDISGRSDIILSDNTEDLKGCLEIAKTSFYMGRDIYPYPHTEPDNYITVFPRYAFYVYITDDEITSGQLNNEVTPWQF